MKSDTFLYVPLFRPLHIFYPWEAPCNKVSFFSSITQLPPFQRIRRRAQLFLAIKEMPPTIFSESPQVSSSLARMRALHFPILPTLRSPGFSVFFDVESVAFLFQDLRS